MARKVSDRQSKGSRGRGRRWPWFLVAGVITLLVAVFVYRLTISPSGVGTPSTTGATVPTTALPSTAGHAIALSDYKGKKLVVYFYEGYG